MGIHGCNELCDLHPHLHSAQRELLDMEGHEENAKELLLERLKVRHKNDSEMIEILEN